METNHWNAGAAEPSPTVRTRGVIRRLKFLKISYGNNDGADGSLDHWLAPLVRTPLKQHKTVSQQPKKHKKNERRDS